MSRQRRRVRPCGIVLFFDAAFILDTSRFHFADARTVSKLIKAIYFRGVHIFRQSKRLASEITGGFNDRFLRLCHTLESRSVPPQARDPHSSSPVPYGTLRSSLSSLFLPPSVSPFLSSPTTALRKLVNPARNCESTRTSRVENDRSNPAFGTRLRPKIVDTYIYTHTHTYSYKGGCEPPTVIRSLLDSCAFPTEFNVAAVAAIVARSKCIARARSVGHVFVKSRVSRETSRCGNNVTPKTRGRKEKRREKERRKGTFTNDVVMQNITREIMSRCAPL